MSSCRSERERQRRCAEQFQPMTAIVAKGVRRHEALRPHRQTLSGRRPFVLRLFSANTARTMVGKEDQTIHCENLLKKAGFLCLSPSGTIAPSSTRIKERWSEPSALPESSALTAGRLRASCLRLRQGGAASHDLRSAAARSCNEKHRERHDQRQ